MNRQINARFEYSTIRKVPNNKNTRLPLQKLLELNFLSVIRLEDVKHELSIVPHRHDHYEFLFITEGGGLHTIDFKEYALKSGRLFFSHPGQVHLIDRIERKGWLVMFGSELFNRFLGIHREEEEKGLLDWYSAFPYIDLNTHEQAFFFQLITWLIAELQKPEPDRDILLHYTALLLIKANRLHASQHPKSIIVQEDRTLYYRLKLLIEQHLKEQHQASFYAQQLRIDIKRLNKICAGSTGFSVAGLLKNRLLTESKILLQTTSLSIKLISYDLGFNDPAFFGRFFKKHTGLTPAEFRALRLI